MPKVREGKSTRGGLFPFRWVGGFGGGGGSPRFWGILSASICVLVWEQISVTIFARKYISWRVRTKYWTKSFSDSHDFFYFFSSVFFFFFFFFFTLFHLCFHRFWQSTFSTDSWLYFKELRSVSSFEKIYTIAYVQLEHPTLQCYSVLSTIAQVLRKMSLKILASCFMPYLSQAFESCQRVRIYTYSVNDLSLKKFLQ